MYELIQITEKSHYIQCPAKIGLVQLGEKDVCVITDSRVSDEARSNLERAGVELVCA